jgi:endonuclease YncB( thermonuclease family)
LISFHTGLRLLLATLVFLCFTARAEELTGQIVAVHSGDSFSLQDGSGKRHVVRLIAVSAPRTSQPYHTNSLKNLTELALNKSARVVWTRRNDLGQIVAKAFISEPTCSNNCALDRDLGLTQLEAGMAWWFKEERKEQTLHDQGYYEYAEFDAKQRRIGLWFDNKPIAPWQWRTSKQQIVRSLLLQNSNAI